RGRGRLELTTFLEPYAPRPGFVAVKPPRGVPYEESGAMLRTLVCACLALVLCTLAVLAAEYKDAKITKIDTDKNKVTFTSDGKEKTLPVDKDAEWSGPKGKIDKEVLEKISKFIADKGATADITTKGEGDKEVVTKVNFKFGKGGKDKDK